MRTIIARAGLALASLLALVPGCRSPRTEVIVVVDTDLRSPPGAIDAFRVVVTAPDGTMQTSMATLSDGPPPRTLGLVHTTGPLGPFRVRAEGLTGGVTRLARDASFTFVRGETRMLRMDLLASCVTTTCGPMQTCGERGCRPVEVTEAELLPWTGMVPGLDASVGDVPARDGGPDVPMRDTPMDTPLDTPPDSPDAPTCVDGDGDGFPVGSSCDGVVDCDDGAIMVFPGATEVCNGVDDDCNMTVDDGFDLMTDDLNCGMCGRVCNFQHSTGSACMGGVCTIGMCDAGFDDCNMDGTDGCEVDLTMDAMNCGMCGNGCRPPDRVCCMSACARTCP